MVRTSTRIGTVCELTCRMRSAIYCGRSVEGTPVTDRSRLCCSDPEGLNMLKIDREHPEYVARKAMWRQYKDLYAGGERLRANASEYLVRRHKEPGQVYQERLGRVFYENYIGSIIDWFAATLVRRAPSVTIEGGSPGSRGFYNILAHDCDLKGTNLSEYFRQRFVQTLVSGASYIAVDFPRSEEHT